MAVRVVLFGGLAKDRPYPGSTMVTGGVAHAVDFLLTDNAVNAVNWTRVGSSVGSAGVALRDYEGLEGR